MADYNSIYTGEEIDAAVGNAKTAGDLKTAYESNADTNAFTDAEKTKLSGITAGAEVNAVDSVFGRIGAVTAQIGDYTKSDVGLGNVDNTSDVNKPISTATQTALDSKQGSLTLTTTGTSGASTLIGDTLNIPNYAVGGGEVDSVNGQTGAVVLDTGDIAEATDANYVSDAQLVVIGNTSGTNTGDQDISGIATNASAISTLDGEVVKKSDYTSAHSILVQQSGTGSPESLSIGTNTLVGRLSLGSSEIDDLTPTQVRTLINVEDGAQVNTIDAGDNVSELFNDVNYITETNVTGTSRQYTSGQAMTNVALTISTGEIALDLTLGNSFTLILDASAELQLPTVDRPQSVQIRVLNEGGNTLTFATGYKVLGDEPTTTDTEYCLINIACFGDDTPWLTCNNQPA